MHATKWFSQWHVYNTVYFTSLASFCTYMHLIPPANNILIYFVTRNNYLRLCVVRKTTTICNTKYSYKYNRGVTGLAKSQHATGKYWKWELLRCLWSHYWAYFFLFTKCSGAHLELNRLITQILIILISLTLYLTCISSHSPNSSKASLSPR